MQILGVDTGGTFTDFVLWDGTRLRTHKVLSTPEAPEQAILQGIDELGISDAGLRLAHGSTVATNAVLEDRGVPTLLVTNRGFADVLTIGRQQRTALYDLQPPAVSPPVPASQCVEVSARTGADGTRLVGLSAADLSDLRERLASTGAQAVAVCLLFAYLDPADEAAIGAALPPDVFVSLSSEVLPEIREYERAMATWLNASVGPLVDGYLRRLGRALPAAQISVMQSSGDTVAADQAGRQAVRMLLSGPAGGLVGAPFVAGQSRLLTFDMGGTSTDVALLDGAPQLTTEGRIGTWPVAVPMVDMHTIGAGGGSIGWLDAGGMLQVGPRSAGASPGPACYGRGGALPTVTDAHLLLGHLQPDAFLGGRMPLDMAAARQAMEPLAAALGTDIEAAAAGIIRIANEHMARALRVMSVERGEDPAGCSLVCFGGAGGLHVCDLAEQLGMHRAIAPSHAGVLSALGMLVARPGRQLSRTWLRPLQAATVTEIDQALHDLAEQGCAALAQEGVAAAHCQRQPSLDLRYRGQSYTLNLPWDATADMADRFHAAHEARFGHRLPMPVELVNLRMAVRGPAAGLTLPTLPTGAPAAPQREVAVWHVAGPVPQLPRAALPAGQRLQGPAVITEDFATLWLRPGWQLEVDRVGNLCLERMV